MIIQSLANSMNQNLDWFHSHLAFQMPTKQYRSNARIATFSLMLYRLLSIKNKIRLLIWKVFPYFFFMLRYELIKVWHFSSYQNVKQNNYISINLDRKFHGKIFNTVSDFLSHKATFTQHIKQYYQTRLVIERSLACSKECINY